MRLAVILVAAVSLAACAEKTAQESAKSEPNASQTEPAAKPDPVEEIVALTRESTVPPPTLLDPPVETTTATGLHMMTYAEGNGQTAAAGDLVAVHYTGWLREEGADDNKGKKFDSSLDRGEPITFALGKGKVIKGWDEGLEGMSEGGKRTLTIPPDLAYGSRNVGNGLIPPDSTLIFDVELVSVSKP